MGKSKIKELVNRYLLSTLAVLTNRRHEFNRWHGVFLLALYAVYLTYRLMNC